MLQDSAQGFAFKAALPAAYMLSASCAGKGRPLMPTPNLYTRANAPQLINDLSDELKAGRLDLLCVTDRAVEYDDSGQLSYGHGRLRSAAFGSAVVELKPQMSWETLEKVSVERDRSVALKMELVSTVELGRFDKILSDKAIGKAERFFKSFKRIGRLGVEDISQPGLDSIAHTERHSRPARASQRRDTRLKFAK